MKLKFDSTLDYQQEAIAAVRDVFKGQTAKQSLFTVAAIANEQMSLKFGGESEQLILGQGIGNRLELDSEDILKNIREVELRHGLPQSKTLGNELNLDSVCSLTQKLNILLYFVHFICYNKCI